MSKAPAVSTKQHVHASFRDAIYTNLNIGLAESYFCAFMLALGISEVISGLGTVIPQFIGVVFQLFSIRSFFRKYSLKDRILFFLGAQALTMVPLILVAWFKKDSAVLVIGIMGAYWAGLLSLNPPWNRLIGHTVPPKFRLKFFSIRNQYAQLSVFAGLITSGVLLHLAEEKNKVLLFYMGIFSLGFCLKCLSWFEIKYHHKDYPLVPGSENRTRLRDLMKRLGTDQGKLITFLFFFYMAVHFSAPYFNPYMLKHLKFNYLQYMLITAVANFGRVLTFRVLQKKARSRHINALLIFSSLGVATTPFLWSLWQNYWWIFTIEFLSGCYWAGFELSTILLYYEKISDSERTSLITYITFLNTTGMILGSLLGAAFIDYFPVTGDPYLSLFATSTVLRILIISVSPYVNLVGRLAKIFKN